MVECKISEVELVELAVEVLATYFERYFVEYEVHKKLEKNLIQIDVPITCMQNSILHLQFNYTDNYLYYDVWDKELEEGVTKEIPHKERYNRKDFGGIKLQIIGDFQGEELNLMNTKVGVWTKAYQISFNKENYYKGLRVCITKQMNIYPLSDINALVYFILQFISEAYGGYAKKFYAKHKSKENLFYMQDDYYLPFNAYIIENLKGKEEIFYVENHKSKS